jgi:hypothetical protein
LTLSLWATIFMAMHPTMNIDAQWDPDAEVWVATSADLPGLVVEASSWSSMIEEVSLAVPDLLEVEGKSAAGVTLSFRAEQRLDLTA